MSNLHWEIFKNYSKVREYVSSISRKSISNLEELLENVQEFLDTKFETLLYFLANGNKTTLVYDLLLKYFDYKVLLSEFVYNYSKIPNPWYLIDKTVEKEIRLLNDKAKGIIPNKEYCWITLGKYFIQHHGPIVAYKILNSWLSGYSAKKRYLVKTLEKELGIKLPGLHAFWKSYRYRILDEVFEDFINKRSLKIGFLSYFLNTI